MKTHSLLLTAALAGAVVSGGLAWRASAVSEMRAVQPTAIAVVDPTRVLDGLEERTALETRLSNDIKSRQEQLQKVGERVEALTQDLKIMKPDAVGYNDKRAELYVLRNQLQTSAQAQQQVLSLMRGDVLRELYNKISAASQKIAESQGYDIVLLDDSGFPLPTEANDRDMERLILSRSIIYHSEAIDITNLVVAQLNSEYRAAGKAPTR